MLPKSQCWSLAEDSSKFVLQIRRPNYWRIEIPVTNASEQALAMALKGVWDQILQFEKTECPFKRSFTVVLPEKPKTPMKKRPWTPPVKRALPVLSTPAHEVEASPTPKALTPSTGRRASTASLRGRSEQRRLSAISNDFQSSFQSREASAETLKSVESKHDEQTRTSDSTTPLTVAETEPEPAAGANLVHNVETAPQVPAAEQENGKGVVIDTDTTKASENYVDVTSGDSTAVEVKMEDHAFLPDLVNPVEKQSAKLPKVEEALRDAGESARSAKIETIVDAIAKNSEAIAAANEANSSTTTISAPSTGLCPEEGMTSTKTDQKAPKSSNREGDESLSATSGNSRAEGRTVTGVIPERLTEYCAPHNEIKEQLITVEISPKTPSSTDASTPTPTNIYDVIRNYENKMAAAATPEPLPNTDEGNAAAEISQAEVGTVSETGSGNESHSGTDEEAVLEGSGVVGGRRKKLRGFRAGRALVPPQLTLVTSPPSKSAMRSTPILEEAVSPTGSTDSFHSSRSWHSPVTPVPRSPASDVSPTRFPYPHDNILIPKKPWHYRDISDLTVTPETRRTWDATSSLTDDSSQESAATAPDVASEAVEQPDKVALSEDEAAATAVARRPYIRHRSTTSSISVGNRALSPLPSAANLFAPTAVATRYHPLRSRLELVRRIPMAIVSKTCEVLLGPPGHLITLMLQVAAKIAAGQWRGMMFGYGEGGETIPVQWDYSDDEYDSWGENDDFYLSHVESSRANSVIGTDDSDNEAANDNPNGTGRGWEVD